MTTSRQLASLWKLPLDWKSISCSNILVAGASGLIGSALVRALASNPNKDYRLFALGRNKKKLERIFSSFENVKDIIFIEGDINSTLKYDIDFHYIVDCASNATPEKFRFHPVETIRTNILGVDNLLSYGVSHNMKRFLYVSTGEVYGEDRDKDFSECDCGFVDSMNPRSCYPVSKRAAENLCAAYKSEHGADIVIARPCHIYGPNFLDSDDRAYAQFLRKASKGEDIVLNSLGLLRRSWCYIVDCISGLLYILLKGESGQAYNIADSPFTIREFAEKIAAISNVRVKINVDQSIPAPIISQGVLCPTKLEGLGWQRQGSLEDNIKSTLNELS